MSNGPLENSVCNCYYPQPLNKCFITVVLNGCLLSQDLKPKGSPLKYRILENSVLMAFKTKPNVEKALSQFMEIATTEVCKLDHNKLRLCVKKVLLGVTLFFSLSGVVMNQLSFLFLFFFLACGLSYQMWLFR